MKRFFSWVVLMLELPAVAAVLGAVNYGLNALRDLFNGTESELEGWFLENAVFEFGLAEIVTVGLLYLLLEGASRLSLKICDIKTGGRYYVLMILLVLAGLFFGYCLARGGLPFATPFEVRDTMLIGAAIALFANAWWVFQDLHAAHKKKKERDKMFRLFKKGSREITPSNPEPIVIFCYEKQGGNGAIPFAYIPGGPGLLREGVKPEVPGRDGLGFDRNLFLRMKEKVLDQEFKGSGILHFEVYAIAGFVVGGKAMCQDLVKNLKGSQFTHVDMLNPSDGEGIRMMGFDMADLRKCRRIDFDPAWMKTPAAAPMPRTKEELIYEIGEYTGYDIFQSSDRLGIDLHDNCTNYEKLDLKQMQQMLQDLREHVKK